MFNKNDQSHAIVCQVGVELLAEYYEILPHL